MWNFWIIFDIFGWQFRIFLIFWNILSHFEFLWHFKIFYSFWNAFDIFESIGTFWIFVTLKKCDIWNCCDILKYFKKFWNILEYIVTFRIFVPFKKNVVTFWNIFYISNCGDILKYLFLEHFGIFVIYLTFLNISWHFEHNSKFFQIVKMF